jgi:MFS family permease
MTARSSGEPLPCQPSSPNSASESSQHRKVNLLAANIVSSYQAGAFFGAFFAYPFGRFLGRRRGIAVFATLFVLGAGIMLGANGHRGLGLIYAGRVLAGMGVGGT